MKHAVAQPQQSPSPASQARQGRCGAVIIAYHPEPGALEGLIDLVLPQVDQLIVIDNGGAERASPICLDERPGLVVEQADSNLGVAGGFNRGVERLIAERCNSALLLDQDSRPPPDLVSTLQRERQRLQLDGLSVAAIGPRIRDHEDHRAAPFIRFALPFNRRLDRCQGSEPCDFLISSGSLLDLSLWPEIGPMRTAWFIDNIDLEWCFRARRCGHAIVGCHEVVLDHRIGQRERLLGWLPYRRHSPERLYTMMRNRIFLYRSQASMAFVVHDALRALGKLVLFSLIRPRRAHLAQMLSGLRDGWRTRPIP